MRLVWRPRSRRAKRSSRCYLSPVFLHRGRHGHDAPDLRFAGLGPDEHRQQLAGVEAIGLRPPAPPVDFDTRGVDDAVGDAAVHDRPVEPEAVAPGLITALYRCRGVEAEVGLRASELRHERREAAGRYRADARRLIDAGRHRQLPLGVAELEGDEA